MIVTLRSTSLAIVRHVSYLYLFGKIKFLLLLLLLELHPICLVGSKNSLCHSQSIRGHSQAYV